jgi:G:T-mismatch repair DNA endonuclease (very short patch repair protein)
VDCYWNRHTCLPVRDVTTVYVGKLAEWYEETMFRLNGITRAGYTVKVMWECEFEETLRLLPELQTHLVGIGPLRTRDALYGVHIEAMRLHYRVKKGGEETI